MILLENGVELKKTSSGYLDREGGYWGRNLVDIFMNIILEGEIQETQPMNEYGSWDMDNTDYPEYRNPTLEESVRRGGFRNVSEIDNQVLSKELNLRDPTKLIEGGKEKIAPVTGKLAVAGKDIKNLSKKVRFKEGRTQATDSSGGSILYFIIAIFIFMWIYQKI